VDMDPLKGSAILEIDPAITFSIIDRLFGGQGEGAKFSRELTDIEQSVMEGIIVRVLGNLRESWSTVIDLRPRLGGIETNPQFAGIVPPSEMVVLVTLETKVGEVEGMMNLCIPYLTIEPIISKLSGQYWYSSARRGTTTENLNILRDRLASVTVTLSAEIGNMEIPVREVLALRPGDIIRLDSVRVADPMPLKVGDRKKFLCRPGVLGNKLAVQIVKKLEDIEQAEFEELATGLEEES
jgi:flagellar motor switch protein FliM